MIEAELRLCPVCGGNERLLVYRQRFMDGPMGDGYDVVVCKQCGAGFADGIPSQAEMDRYYTEQSRYTYDYADGAESPWDLKRFEATADQIIPRLKSANLRILDIGCATGGLMSVFMRRGFRNVMGVDPSPTCSAAASRLNGVAVKCATFSTLSTWRQKFDLILMVGVLEHVREPKHAVRIASKLLRPGGLVYCAVPDVEGLDSCPNAPYQQFSVEHVNFFSINSLNAVMARCGMSVLHAGTWKVEWRERVWEPIASGMYQRGSAPKPLFDGSTGPALQRYLAVSEEGDRKINSVIDSLLGSKEPILVWGAGTLARRLLAATNFSALNIVMFVDSNRRLHGSLLAGRPIVRPSQIAGRKESILVCSAAFGCEIAGVIRNQHRLQNRIISILGEDLA